MNVFRMHRNENTPSAINAHLDSTSIQKKLERKSPGGFAIPGICRFFAYPTFSGIAVALGGVPFGREDQVSSENVSTDRAPYSECQRFSREGN